MYAALPTSNDQGFRGLRGLACCGRKTFTLGAAAGALTPSQAFEKALALYSGEHLNSRDTQNQAWISAMTNAIAAGSIPLTSECAGTSAPPLNLFQTAGGFALGTTGAGVGIAAAAHVITAAVATAATAVIAGVGVIIGIISMIFAHHAAAVKRDLNFECSALPAVNNAFALIDQAVQSGKMNPSDAAQALEEIYSQYMKAGGAGGSSSGPSGIPSGGNAINNHPFCNSNCELSIAILGIVFYRQSQYEAIAAQQNTAPGTSSGFSAAPIPGTSFAMPSPKALAIGALLIGAVWALS